MNVVTANENKEIIDRLDIDIIKRIVGQFELKELLSKFVNLYFNKMIIDITSIADYRNTETINQLAKAVDPSRVILLLNSDPTVNSQLYMSNLIKNGFYNFTRNYEGIKFLYNTPNTYENVKHLVLSEDEVRRQEFIEEQKRQNANVTGDRKIIGVASLSQHAGATSLVNMMVRQLNNHGIKTIGIEMFRQDLMYYHDPNLSSCMSKLELETKLRTNSHVDVILDLNEFGEADKYCTDIIYLIEPSYVKLTKLLKKNKNTFMEHKDDKIVLNISFVNDQEVPDFEYETKCKIFDNIPPLNDRATDLAEVNELLSKLGFSIDITGM